MIVSHVTISKDSTITWEREILQLQILRMMSHVASRQKRIRKF